MRNSLLLGIWRVLVPLPRPMWQGEVIRSAKKFEVSLKKLPEEHFLVRNFVVEELPRFGAPLSPEVIANQLDMPIDQVQAILDDLEKKKVFLFRNEEGAVTWAYPVTAVTTPHRITFSTGEIVNAAWAVDAIATPFVQGCLRKEPLTFTIETKCDQTGRPIKIEIDSNLNYRLITPDCNPLIFAPMVDFDKLQDPSIIDAFWRKSVFFWSEEQAKISRKAGRNVRGTYMTLDQSAFVTPILQGALFGFEGKHMGMREWNGRFPQINQTK